MCSDRTSPLSPKKYACGPYRIFVVIATDFQQDVAEAVVRLIISTWRETPGTLNAAAAATLDALHASGPMRVCDLATMENISQPGIAMLVNKLVRMGYAEKFCDPDDAQASVVRLTPPEGKPCSIATCHGSRL